jgi:hypothetical protein
VRAEVVSSMEERKVEQATRLFIYMHSRVGCATVRIPDGGENPALHRDPLLHANALFLVG